jgi:hypothetical protein
MLIRDSAIGTPNSCARHEPCVYTDTGEEVTAGIGTEFELRCGEGIKRQCGT